MSVSRALTVVALVTLAGGCGSLASPPRPNAMLERADRLAREGAWEQAAIAYGQYVARYPADPAAPRAAASRDTLTALVRARAELTRLRDEIARLKDDMARRDSDLVRARQEADRLRLDLERLKQIDLKMERRR